MQKDMKNIAYSKEYLDNLADIYRYLFIPECGKSEVYEELGNEINILTKEYFFNSDNPECPYNLEGSNNIVYKKGKEIYSFKTVNSSGYHWLINHQNGYEYLVFKKDLYGYSILDLKTMQDFNYFPVKSFPTGETFIWCDIHYNSMNNIMAVSGCYWACPWSIVLVDFSNPMADSIQIDINEFINQGYNHYDDIDFVSWDGTDLIIRMNGQTNSTQKNERTISSNEYMSWF